MCEECIDSLWSLPQGAFQSLNRVYHPSFKECSPLQEIDSAIPVKWLLMSLHICAVVIFKFMLIDLNDLAIDGKKKD